MVISSNIQVGQAVPRNDVVLYADRYKFANRSNAVSRYFNALHHAHTGDSIELGTEDNPKTAAAQQQSLQFQLKL